MKLLNDFINLFITDHNSPIIEENFDEATCFLSTNSLNFDISESGLNAIIKKIPIEDELLVTISNDIFSETIDFKRENNQAAFEDLKSYKREELESNSTVRITINKSDKADNIYSIEHFFNFLSNQSLTGVLNLFSKYVLNTPNPFYFNLIDEEDNKNYSFNTYRLHFNTSFKRARIDTNKFNIINNYCHFFNAIKYQFTPDDFYLIKRSNNENINLFFDKLSTVFSIISLSNISSINNNDLQYKIEGYKRIEEIIDYNTIDTQNNIVLFSVYQRCYNSGNIVDKLGIVRNLLPLNINRSITELTDSFLFSVESNHNIYLKENVNKYIEIKQTIVSELTNYTQSTNQIADTVSDGIKKNLLTIVTFFFTILVFNTINSGKISNIFTKDISTLAFMMIGISFLMLISSWFDVSRKTKKYKLSYNRLKKRYLDILDINDIKKVFDNDTEYLDNIKSINKSTIQYSIIWILILVIISIVVNYLSFS